MGFNLYKGKKVTVYGFNIQNLNNSDIPNTDGGKILSPYQRRLIKAYHQYNNNTELVMNSNLLNQIQVASPRVLDRVGFSEENVFKPIVEYDINNTNDSNKKALLNVIDNEIGSDISLKNNLIKKGQSSVYTLNIYINNMMSLIDRTNSDWTLSNTATEFVFNNNETYYFPSSLSQKFYVNKDNTKAYTINYSVINDSNGDFWFNQIDPNNLYNLTVKKTMSVVSDGSTTELDLIDFTINEAPVYGKSTNKKKEVIDRDSDGNVTSDTTTNELIDYQDPPPDDTDDTVDNDDGSTTETICTYTNDNNMDLGSYTFDNQYKKDSKITLDNAPDDKVVICSDSIYAEPDLSKDSLYHLDTSILNSIKKDYKVIQYVDTDSDVAHELDCTSIYSDYFKSIQSPVLVAPLVQNYKFLSNKISQKQSHFFKSNLGIDPKQISSSLKDSVTGDSKIKTAYFTMLGSLCHDSQRDYIERIYGNIGSNQYTELNINGQTIEYWMGSINPDLDYGEDIGLVHDVTIPCTVNKDGSISYHVTMVEKQSNKYRQILIAKQANKDSPLKLIESKKTHCFILPENAFYKEHSKDFYNDYYTSVGLITESSKTYNLKWYQTGTWQTIFRIIEIIGIMVALATENYYLAALMFASMVMDDMQIGPKWLRTALHIVIIIVAAYDAWENIGAEASQAKTATDLEQIASTSGTEYAATQASTIAQANIQEFAEMSILDKMTAVIDTSAMLAIKTAATIVGGVSGVYNQVETYEYQRQLSAQQKKQKAIDKVLQIRSEQIEKFTKNKLKLNTITQTSQMYDSIGLAYNIQDIIYGSIGNFYGNQYNYENAYS